MREVGGQVQGGTLSEDLEVRGQVVGDLRVPAGLELVLRGQVAGTLTIDEGGRAVIFGQVAGAVVNRGSLDVHGMIVGELRDVVGGATVHPGAEIIGRRR